MNINLENKKDFRFESGSGIWFTSDTHFNHDNIIKFCDRPFKSVEEMNRILIENWNDRVRPDDTVFHLGDFAWGGSQVWNSVLQQLNGHIHLIVGNHDEKNLRQGYMRYFESVEYQKHIYVEDRSIYLNHYPFLCYGGAYRGEQATWQLFGHVHSQKYQYDIQDITDEEVKEILGKDTYRLRYLLPTQYDVGVDNNDYRPISFEEVKHIINQQIQDGKEKSTNQVLV